MSAVARMARATLVALPAMRDDRPRVRAPLHIGLLGEIQVVRGGATLPLPASKKTRALLGYLVVAGGRPQTRQRLCELFWDGPDDPRAALRWSLTKLRPLVDDAKGPRIVADREHVAFDARGATSDLASVDEDATQLGPVADASLGALRSAAALFRGELLEGLELPDCYRYHAWCVAQRETVRRRRCAILAALTERLADQPDKALEYARANMAIDPLVEQSHIAVMHLLARLGRQREAREQYESCRRILETQLARGPSKELEATRALLAHTPHAPVHASPKALAPSSDAPLLGRASETTALAGLVGEAARGACRRVVLVAGEPGIGKTRLLRDLSERVVAAGGAALSGRAFEAEMVRPYGAWIDALRSAPGRMIDGSLRADLAPLLPELGATHREADQNRLFDAVGTLLRNLAGTGSVVVVLDDVQWLDEASAALLHYVARRLEGSHVLLALGARGGEVEGNQPVRALLRALLRDGRLWRVDLGPLDAAATRALVQTVSTGIDPEQVFTDGGGNPLFSLELARALVHGDGASPAPTLDGLIADRLSRLDGRAGELVPWAAALGHAFSLDTLAALTSLPAHELLSAIEDLERHGVLRVASSTLGSVGYDFAHDLVRRTAYRSMSEPRRRWVHLQIARSLHATSDSDGALASDVAHHAALGGDSEIAAMAYLSAGERSLRLFAHADASRLAASGLQHAERLAPGPALRLQLSLYWVQVYSRQWMRRSQELEAELARLAQVALKRGMHAETTRAYFLMSFVNSERGDFAAANVRSLQAAEAGRAAGLETALGQLANTARCLILIERDIAHAETLLDEARAMSVTTPMTGRVPLELACAQGLLHAFQGEDDQAGPLLEDAAALAEAAGDPWVQLLALIRMVRMAIDGGRHAEALVRCRDLEPLVAKLAEEGHDAIVQALTSLARWKLGEDGAAAAVESAIERLRVVDSKVMLAYALDVVAEQEACEGHSDAARRRADEALRAAKIVGQKSEVAVARALLARLALDGGDRDRATALYRACEAELAAPMVLSARARAMLVRVGERLGQGDA